MFCLRVAANIVCSIGVAANNSETENKNENENHYWFGDRERSEQRKESMSEANTFQK